MKRVLILGMGKSGQAARTFLEKKGDRVVGFDTNPDLGVTHIPSIDEFDLVVVSPGVSPLHPLYQEAVIKKKKIVGEAELALSELPSNQRCVAITGTNGKTTVTLLVAHILNASGEKARALGNIGEALASACLALSHEEIVVVELSSYQLETMTTPVFDAAVLTNITPDHLDRYPSMEAYAAAKCRLSRCMRKNAPFYVNAQILPEFKTLLKGEYRTYGMDKSCDLSTDKKCIRARGQVECILPEEFASLGPHESENALAAWALCRELGVSRDLFLKGLSSFRKPAHRIEFITAIEGVSYYDDSKGTNIDATIQAVKSMPGPVFLIVGGVDKGASYAPWKPCFLGKVKRIFALGQAAEKICGELQNDFPVMMVSTLNEAVELASVEAKRGECVLLSPGCSSFDMFRDYTHRGEEFKRSVNDLKRKKK